jgi:hypothetical protein
MRHGLALAAALLLLLAAMAFKDVLVRLPSLPDAPSAGFDANRAAARLARILGDQRPHPIDSAANDAVRERLITEMRAVGLQPRVTDDFVCNSFARSRAVACARVRNLVATIGPAEGRNLLLSAHYDSTFAGPGAADAGIGVATLLETAALLRGRPLRRPVTFLINDGEEMGLLGARAFVVHEQLAARVDSVLNFEARGVTGPAVMFETSVPNGTAIAHYARAVDRPVANSLTTDLYRLIPNSTDVAVYEARPWTILNFAIIGNETRYHSPGDDMTALDRRSLQHMGDQALAVTLDLASGEPTRAAGERIYTDLLGLQLVVLPLLFGLILLGILLLFFLVEIKRRRAFGRPLLAMVAAMIGAPALAWVGQLVLGLIRSGDYWRGYPIVTEIAVYGSALAAGLAAFAFIARDMDRTRLRAAYWLLFLLGGAAISLIAPGGSIFVLLPPLVMAVGMALERFWRGAERIAAIVAVAALFLTFAPPLALFEELLNGGPHWVFAPLGAAILLPALIELRPLIAHVRRPLLLAAAADLFLIPWAAAALTPAYSEDRQQHFTIEYVRDTGTGRTMWAVNNDGAPVPFAAPWTRTELPYSLRRRWTSPAPAIAVEAPKLDIVERQIIEGGRRLQLRLRANGAESVTLIAPPESGLRGAGIGGSFQRFIPGTPTERYIVRCVGRSCDGAILDLVAGNRDPIELFLVGTRSGLPAQAAPLVRARRALARPQYAPDSTITVSRIRL